MGLFWGKYWKTKAEAKKMRTAHAKAGTIRKTKQGWGIYNGPRDKYRSRGL